MVIEIIVSKAISALTNLIKDHYGTKDSKHFAIVTKKFCLPQYKILEKLLKENDEWFGSEDYIPKILFGKLGCSREQAKEYAKFYEKYRPKI